jgi:hypothetical protein
LRVIDLKCGIPLAEGQIHRSLGHRPRPLKPNPFCWLKANFNSGGEYGLRPKILG